MAGKVKCQKDIRKNSEIAKKSDNSFKNFRLFIHDNQHELANDGKPPNRCSNYIECISLFRNLEICHLKTGWFHSYIKYLKLSYLLIISYYQNQTQVLNTELVKFILNSLSHSIHLTFNLLNPKHEPN